MIPHLDFNLHFLNDNDDEPVFIGLLDLQVSFLVKGLFKYLLVFKLCCYLS